MQSKETVSSVPETAKQETDIHERWPWVEVFVWTERMLTALENGVKGSKWYSLMDKVYAMGTLQAAWQRVLANNGLYGVDKVSIERFEAHSERYLLELHEVLKAERYQPLPIKRVYIPKGDGGQRPLGIPAVKDWVVQTAMKLVVEPIFEQEFADRSYGFRRGHLGEGARARFDGWMNCLNQAKYG